MNPALCEKGKAPAERTSTGACTLSSRDSFDGQSIARRGRFVPLARALVDQLAERGWEQTGPYRVRAGTVRPALRREAEGKRSQRTGVDVRGPYGLASRETVTGGGPYKGRTPQTSTVTSEWLNGYSTVEGEAT